MFSNIGGKIKKLAMVITVAGIVLSVIAGIVQMSLSRGGGGIFFSGILTMIMGSLAAWVSSFILYGFGQLVEDTGDIKRSLSGHSAPARPNDFN